MKPVLPEEARKKQCMSKKGYCVGDNCLAWKKCYTFSRPNVKPPPISAKSRAWTAPKRKYDGRGYCEILGCKH